jgi:hypothetical protein
MDSVICQTIFIFGKEMDNAKGYYMTSIKPHLWVLILSLTWGKFTKFLHQKQEEQEDNYPIVPTAMSSKYIGLLGAHFPSPKSVNCNP